MTTPHHESVLSAVPFIERWMERAVASRRVAGLQLAIRSRGETVCSRAWGVADQRTGAPLTPQHRMRVASHSKWYAATAVLQLVADGRLRLDDEVAALLPAYAQSPLARVSVRELLGHRAGVVRDGRDAGHWALEQPFYDADRLRAEVAEAGAVYEPNRYFKYSNIGYGLIGQILEKVTGQPFADLMHERIVAPLGLTRTTADFVPERSEEFAVGHARVVDDASGRRITVGHVGTGALAAATGFASCAEDMARFAEAHTLGDQRLLTDRWKRVMQQEESVIRADGDDARRYGLGCFVTRYGERRVVGHSGGFPGFISRTDVDPEQGVAVSVLTNCIDGPAGELSGIMWKLLNLAAKGRADWQAERTAADLARFSGVFESLWGTTMVVPWSGRLLRLGVDAVDPTMTANELSVVDDEHLAVVDQDSFEGPGEQIAVRRDEAGLPCAVTVTGITAYRRDVWPVAGLDHVESND